MTREEAIEVYHGPINTKIKEAFEFFAPELAESEDERIRKFLLDYAVEMIAGLESDILLSTYDGIKGHDPDAEEELNQWQKARAYLKKQKEQKPAEWSEADEKMKERLITRLNWITYNTRTDGTSPNITFFKEIDWLKSLRPPQYCENCRLKKSVQGWKPSEEQIYSLGTVVKGYDECTVGSVGYNLKSLYEQLKKL